MPTHEIARASTIPINTPRIAPVASEEQAFREVHAQDAPARGPHREHRADFSGPLQRAHRQQVGDPEHQDDGDENRHDGHLARHQRYRLAIEVGELVPGSHLHAGIRDDPFDLLRNGIGVRGIVQADDPKLHALDARDLLGHRQGHPHRQIIVGLDACREHATDHPFRAAHAPARGRRDESDFVPARDTKRPGEAAAQDHSLRRRIVERRAIDG